MKGEDLKNEGRLGLSVHIGPKDSENLKRTADVLEVLTQTITTANEQAKKNNEEMVKLTRSMTFLTVVMIFISIAAIILGLL